MNEILAIILTGLLTAAANFAAFRVHLHYHRKAIAHAQRTAEKAHERIDKLEREQPWRSRRPDSGLYPSLKQPREPKET